MYLKLQPYRQKSASNRPFQKLSARFYGPFEITKKIGAVAYELSLPSTARIHPVFHVSQLKRAIGNVNPVPNLPPHLTEDMELHWEPEELLEIRTRKDTTVPRVEVLVKWKGTHASDSTWEDLETLRDNFQDFDLEDKVRFLGRGNVVYPPLQFTFERRKRQNKRRGDQATNPGSF